MSSPIKRPGFIDAVKGAWTIATDRDFDRRHGTRTHLSLRETIKDPGTRGPQPTPERVARRALAGIAADPTGIFVDIGAGNGRVMVLAYELGWRRIVGVEQSAGAVDQARETLDRFAAQSGDDQAGGAFELVAADAASFDLPEHTRVVYLFNPFGRQTMEAFRSRLEQRAERSSAAIQVVYVFPVFGNVLDASPVLTLDRVGRVGGFPFAVFRSDAHSST